VEYFTQPEAVHHDPRKHAVALTYSAACTGVPVACGEASDFRWFSMTDLSAVHFGFGQGDVVVQVATAVTTGGQE
jgi:Domain of unknown function (DUF4916)